MMLMVQVPGRSESLQILKWKLVKYALVAGVIAGAVLLFCAVFTSRVLPNQLGIEQRRLGSQTGIVAKVLTPGLYFVGPGATLHTFPRDIHVLEATDERSGPKASSSAAQAWYKQRDALLGSDSHRTIDAINVQTSDGY